jgi:hypothetical protein
VVEKDLNGVSPTARSGVRLPTTVGPEAPLLVHVGNPKHAARAAIEYDIGALVWRGRTGADLIADQLRDPVTGEDELLDFATYEHNQYAKDASVALPLGGSHLSLAFTPGIFADHRDPQGLTSFLASVPQELAKLRTLGLGDAPMAPVIALTTQWLTEASLLDQATSEIRAFGGLVGVVLASFKNPLHGAGAIRGCVELAPIPFS